MAKQHPEASTGGRDWLAVCERGAWLCVVALATWAIVGVAASRADEDTVSRADGDTVSISRADTAAALQVGVDARPAVNAVASAPGDDALPQPAAQRALRVAAGIERRIEQGGWVMAALFGCSLLVVAVAVERWLATRRSLVWPARLRAIVEGADGIDRDALRVAAKSGTSVGERLVRAGLRAEESGAANVAGVVAEIGSREVARLRTGMPLLATLANMATMLGLFGTVLGMIDAFELIAAEGAGDPRIVAGGIFKALVTTAAGLGIGLLALAIHAGLGARVGGRVRELEDGLGAIFDPAAAGARATGSGGARS